MSIFSSILKGVTGPFRGIAKFAQGDIRGGLGAFGSTAKLAAPIVGATGVGLPLAAGLGAAGGVAERYGEGEGNIGKILGSALPGAAAGAGGHLVSSAGPLSGVGKFLTGAGGEIGSYAAANPEIAVGVASGGANVYGANLAGGVADRQLEMQELEMERREEERQRRAKLDPLQLLFSAYRGF